MYSRIVFFNISFLLIYGLPFPLASLYSLCVLALESYILSGYEICHTLPSDIFSVRLPKICLGVRQIKVFFLYLFCVSVSVADFAITDSSNENKIFLQVF